MVLFFVARRRPYAITLYTHISQNEIPTLAYTLKKFTIHMDLNIGHFCISRAQKKYCALKFNKTTWRFLPFNIKHEHTRGSQIFGHL